MNKQNRNILAEPRAGPVGQFSVGYIANYIFCVCVVCIVQQQTIFVTSPEKFLSV